MDGSYVPSSQHPTTEHYAHDEDVFELPEAYSLGARLSRGISTGGAGAPAAENSRPAGGPMTEDLEISSTATAFEDEALTQESNVAPHDDKPDVENSKINVSILTFLGGIIAARFGEGEKNYFFFYFSRNFYNQLL